MTDRVEKMPEGMGVIAWQGDIVVYQQVEIIDTQVQEGTFGGELRIPVRTGRYKTVAQVQGKGEQFDPGPELLAAIEADRGRS
jgi:hypothetical protein